MQMGIICSPAMRMCPCQEKFGWLPGSIFCVQNSNLTCSTSSSSPSHPVLPTSGRLLGLKSRAGTSDLWTVNPYFCLIQAFAGR